MFFAFTELYYGKFTGRKVPFVRVRFQMSWLSSTCPPLQWCLCSLAGKDAPLEYKSPRPSLSCLGMSMQRRCKRNEHPYGRPKEHSKSNKTTDAAHVPARESRCFTSNPEGEAERENKWEKVIAVASWRARNCQMSWHHLSVLIINNVR